MAIKQRTKSLSARGHDLADTMVQLNVLSGKDVHDMRLAPFGRNVEYVTCEKPGL